MLKGVKTIKCIGGAMYYATRGQRATPVLMMGGTPAKFEVAEWFEGTTEADKKKVEWFIEDEDRNILKQGKTETGTIAEYNISKKYAGCRLYYIEAGIAGVIDRKRQTGLYLKALAAALIISSSWRNNENPTAPEIKESAPASLGQTLFLNLKTEGLNGYDCRIEVYYAKRGDDILMQTYSVKCINGEIDLTVPGSDTKLWFLNLKSAGYSAGQLYVKITANGLNGYVPDDKQCFLHATHLWVNGVLAKDTIKTKPVNNPLLQGSKDTDKTRYDHCRFTAIIVNDNGKDTPVFDPKKLEEQSAAKFKFFLGVYYKTDAYAVQDEYKPLLNNLAAYLNANPKEVIHLDAYTDVRHTHEYNQKLSESRAIAVQTYLIKQGVNENNIKSTGHGDEGAHPFVYLPPNTNAFKDNPFYQLDRKTIVTFYKPEYNSRYLTYYAIVPTIESARELSITIQDLDVAGCNFKGNDNPLKHRKTIRLEEITNAGQIRQVIREIDPDAKNMVKLPIFSDMPNLLPLFNKPNQFSLYINTCSYFADKRSSTLRIQAYTDALWLFNATYNFTDGYFLKQDGVEQKVKLITGIDDGYEKLKPYLDVYFKWVKFVDPLGFQKLLIDYIVEDARSFGLGYHIRWNKIPGGKYNGYNNELDYTNEHKIAAQFTILGLTLAVIAVEIFIVMLTDGAALETAFPKLEKLAGMAKRAKVFIDKLNNLGFTFIYPKLAYNTGTWYQKFYTGNLGMTLEQNVCAKPLIGIDYEKTFDLLKIIAGKSGESKKSLLEVLKKTGNNATLVLKFSGIIEADYSISITVPIAGTGATYNVINKLKDAASARNNKGVVITSSTISGSAELKAAGKIIVQKYLPKIFYTPSIEIDAKLQASLQGYLAFERSYGNKDGRVFYKDEIKFGGIQGEVLIRIKIKVAGDTALDSNPDNRPNQFTLFEPDNITIADVQLF
ncbi:OmpA family protein [Chitinophagaceae bacterium LWZ2-11]